MNIILGLHTCLPLGFTRLQINHGSTVANRTTGKTTRMMTKARLLLSLAGAPVFVVNVGGAVGVKRKS